MSVKQVTITVPMCDYESKAESTLRETVEAFIKEIPELTQIGDFTITSSDAEAYLKWGKADNIRLYVYVKGSSRGYSDIYVYLQMKEGDTEKWTNISYVYSNNSLSHDPVLLTITTSGTDFLHIYCNENTTHQRVSVCRIVDRVTSEEVYLVGSSMPSTLILPDGYKAQPSYSYNAILEGGISGVYAVPVIWYLSDLRRTFSGGPGGLNLIYRIYDNSEGTNIRKTFTDIFTKFSLDGHNFLSLSDDCCIRLD